MSILNQIELQNLANMIEHQRINSEKLANYSDCVVDPQLKQILSKAAQDALNNEQKLITFIKI